jgi:hypothetical protein
MKRTLFSLLFTVICLSTLQAQELSYPKANRWGWGIVAGLNKSYPVFITGLPLHVNPNYSPTLGVDVNYRINNRSTLHIQPQWAQLNSAGSNGWYGPIYSITSVKLPVLYRYYLLPGKQSLFVEGGLSFNQIVESNYQEQQMVFCFAGPCPILYSQNLAPITTSAVSGIAGIGLNLNLHKISIPVSFRYERSLTNYAFPKYYDAPPTPLRLENIGFITGVNF